MPSRAALALLAFLTLACTRDVGGATVARPWPTPSQEETWNSVKSAQEQRNGAQTEVIISAHTIMRDGLPPLTAPMVLQRVSITSSSKKIAQPNFLTYRYVAHVPRSQAFHYAEAVEETAYARLPAVEPITQYGERPAISPPQWVRDEVAHITARYPDAWVEEMWDIITYESAYHGTQWEGIWTRIGDIDARDKCALQINGRWHGHRWAGENIFDPAVCIRVGWEIHQESQWSLWHVAAIAGLK